MEFTHQEQSRAGSEWLLIRTSPCSPTLAPKSSVYPWPKNMTNLEVWTSLVFLVEKVLEYDWEL